MRKNLVELYSRKKSLGSINVNTNIASNTDDIDTQLSEDTSFVFNRSYDDLLRMNEYFNSQDDMYIRETSVNEESNKSNILKYILIGILIFLGISYLTRR